MDEPTIQTGPILRRAATLARNNAVPLLIVWLGFSAIVGVVSLLSLDLSPGIQRGQRILVRWAIMIVSIAVSHIALNDTFEGVGSTIARHIFPVYGQRLLIWFPLAIFGVVLSIPFLVAAALESLMASVVALILSPFCAWAWCFVAVMYSMALPLKLAENTTAFASLGESRRFTKGVRLALSLSFLPMFIITSIASVVLAIATMRVDFIAADETGMLAQALYFPVTLLFVAGIDFIAAAAYVELRGAAHSEDLTKASAVFQ